MGFAFDCEFDRISISVLNVVLMLLYVLNVMLHSTLILRLMLTSILMLMLVWSSCRCCFDVEVVLQIDVGFNGGFGLVRFGF